MLLFLTYTGEMKIVELFEKQIEKVWSRILNTNVGTNFQDKGERL